MTLRTVRIRDPKCPRYDGMDAEVLLARDDWAALVYFADDPAIAIVQMPSRFNGTPRTYQGKPYFEIEAFMSLPRGMDANHWITMFTLGT